MTQPWYVNAYDEHYYESYREEFTPEQTAAEIDGVLPLLGLDQGARVLDLCCGFGRHSLELARRGCRVAGLDLSPALLAHAREAAVSEGLEIDWIEADMRDIPVPAEPYDAVLMLFSSFGVFDNDTEEARVAEAVARVLKPGGGVLIDTVNRELMLRRWMPRRWMERPDGTLLLNRMRFDILTGIWHSHETVIHPDGQRREDEHRLRFWTYTELAGLLTRAGFTSPAGYGGLDGSRYTWDSMRMVVTARRAD